MVAEITNLNITYSDVSVSLDSTIKQVSKTKNFEDLQAIVRQGGEAVQNIEVIQKHTTIWTKLVDFFYHLFGLVTEYEKLQQQAAKLEAKIQDAALRISFTTDIQLNENSLHKTLFPNESKEQLERELDLVRDQITTLSLSICEKAKEVLDKFSILEIRIAHLRKLYDSTLFPSEEQSRKNAAEASDLASLIKEIEDTVCNLSRVYNENSFELSIIKTIVVKYQSALKELKMLQSGIAEKWTNEEARKISNEVVVGGIQNGGSTCYLASALQAINAIPAYKASFNPAINGLKRHEKESKESFIQRKEVQKLGFILMNQISDGKRVETQQINAFRNACFKLNIVPSLSGTADSYETLERLLDAMGNKSDHFSVKYDWQPNLNTGKVVEVENQANISTLKELNKEESVSFIDVSPLNHLGQTVSMQKLINDNWAPEVVSDVIMKLDEGGGSTCKRFGSIKKNTMPCIEGKPPEVIKVTVKQLNDEKATISHPEFIFPFGEGKGPRYQLKAVIEHLPGHYVAHLFQNGKVFVANDSSVDSSRGRPDMPGYAYFYTQCK